jgi:hypothetical protein
MTSIAQLGHPQISLGAIASSIEQPFATVFGYDQVEHLDDGAISHLDVSAPSDAAAHG